MHPHRAPAITFWVWLGLLGLTTTTSTVAATPYTHTQFPNPISVTNAILNGMAVPNGEEAIAWFEYGNRGAFSHTTSPTNIGAGVEVVRVSSPILGLTNGGLYQFRLVSSNLSGVVTGHTRIFTTGARISQWGTSGTPILPAGLSNVVQFSAGGFHPLAVHSSGSVTEWVVGTTTIVTNGSSILSNLVAVAGGAYCYAALDVHGAAYRWIKTGATNLVSGMSNVLGSSNVIEIAVGSSSGVQGFGGALTTEGKVFNWSYFIQPTLPILRAGLSNVVALACGYSHFTALKADGTIASWDSMGTSVATNVPSGLTNIVAIAADSFNNLALRRDGTVVAWGSAAAVNNVPSGLTNVIAISVGPQNGMAMTEDGNLIVWGSNSGGQTNPPSGLNQIAGVYPSYSSRIFALAANLAPVALVTSSSGFPNRDLTLSFNGTDANGDQLSAKIISLPSKGNLYQYNAGTGSRGTPITTPVTSVTDPSRRVIYAPASNTAGSPYTTFGFALNDGFADSLLTTRNINIILPTAPQFSLLRSAPTSDGKFDLNFTGTATAVYRVWASSNLVNWDPLGTATSPSNGWFNFVDNAATNYQIRFYRAGAP